MIGLQHDYSWSESILSFWATLILTVLAVTSLALRYVTNPLSCHLPAHFVSSTVDYALSVCFHTTSISAVLPTGSSRPVSPQSTYHQWLPFFLGVCATLCLLPHAVSRMFAAFLWLDAHQLVQTLTSNQLQNAAGRHVILRDCALLLQAGLRGGNCVLGMAAMGRKVLGCVVCFLQMLLMLVVFAPQLHVQTDSASDGYVENENDTMPLPLHFFLCDFETRQLRTVHQYSVMCFMPLAQVYSKGLVFLFYLFLVLFLLCIVDLLLFTLRLLVPDLKDVALKRFLSVADQSGKNGQGSGPAQSSRFLDSLGLDGRLVLAVVADHCGALAAADLTTHLWQVFKESPRPSHGESCEPASACADGAGGDVESVPMVTVTDQDGDDAAKEDEKGKLS